MTNQEYITMRGGEVDVGLLDGYVDVKTWPAKTAGPADTLLVDAVAACRNLEHSLRIRNKTYNPVAEHAEIRDLCERHLNKILDDRVARGDDVPSGIATNQIYVAMVRYLDRLRTKNQPARVAQTERS